MQTYNITITPEDSEEEVQFVECFAEDMDAMTDIIKDTNNMKDGVKFHSGDNYIVIEAYSEGGYYYSRYKDKKAYEEGEEDIDGGLCTSTISGAIDMALNA